MTNEILKKCIKCGVSKSLSEFYISKSSKDGRRGDCKICNKIITKKYREENADRVKKLKSQKMYVTCEFNTSDKCVKEYLIGKYEYNKNIKRNNGRYRCIFCAINDTHLDKSKYDIDYSFFNKIDSEIKSYLLGIIAGDGHINSKCEYLEVVANNQDIETLLLIKKHISHNNNIKRHNSSANCSKILICSKSLCKDICKQLNILPGKKSDKISLPNLDNSLIIHFIRGLMDSDGWISAKNKRCFYSSSSQMILKQVQEFASKYKINSNIHGIKLDFCGDNANMFLTMLYDKAKFFLKRKRERFGEWK